MPDPTPEENSTSPDATPEASGATADVAVSGLEEQRAQRLAKVAALRDSGTDPYPSRFDRSHTAAEVRDRYEGLDAGAETDDRVAVAGRIVLMRRQGKLTFATIADRGERLQLFVSRAVIGEAAHVAFDDFDLGDWIGVEGTVMVTRKGELSVKVDRAELLAKALRPLPDKWHGLTDTDTRYRQRYVDLVVNEDARRTFAVRSAVVDALRTSLRGRGFVEVETPVLHHELGGAHAKPFTTHHNALDQPMYLRIALELHLKRLVVGGMDRVFEIGRIFRNEGIDTKHNPEFTMLEAYEAFTDYVGMMELTEGLVREAAQHALGTTVVNIGGSPVDLATPWRRVTMVDAIREYLDLEITPSMPPDAAHKVLDDLGLDHDADWGSGRCTHAVYDELVEHRIGAPTFVIDHPAEVSPLAKRCPKDPDLVERFELIVGGHELANAYSELNDPIDQRERFVTEQRRRLDGDDEAGTIDEDYLRALEFGLPPTGGLGIGLDRLVMLLAGVTSIREVILFPTLRAEGTE